MLLSRQRLPRHDSSMLAASRSRLPYHSYIGCGACCLNTTSNLPRLNVNYLNHNHIPAYSDAAMRPLNVEARGLLLHD